MSEAKRPRKVRRSFIYTIAPLGVVVLLFVSLSTAGMGMAPQAENIPMSSSVSSASQTPMATEEQKQQDPVPSPTSSALPSIALQSPSEPAKLVGQPSRLVYGAAGIDLPIAALDQVSGPFVPPAEKNMGYWLTHRPGYILAHSAELEKWPFNALTTSARVGDVIVLTAPTGEVRYKVTDVTSYPKYDLEVDGKTPVWDIDDRLLRLIGCKDGDVWEQVTVVTAIVQ